MDADERTRTEGGDSTTTEEETATAEEADSQPHRPP